MKSLTLEHTLAKRKRCEIYIYHRKLSEEHRHHKIGN